MLQLRIPHTQLGSLLHRSQPHYTRPDSGIPGHTGTTPLMSEGNILLSCLQLAMISDQVVLNLAQLPLTLSNYLEL